MEKFTAAEAKQKFGQLLDKAQKGPVQITKHGQAVSVVMSQSDYDLDQYYRRKWIAEKLKIADEDLKAGRVTDAETVRAEMKAYIRETYDR